MRCIPSNQYYYDQLLTAHQQTQPAPDAFRQDYRVGVRRRLHCHHHGHLDPLHADTQDLADTAPSRWYADPFYILQVDFVRAKAIIDACSKNIPNYLALVVTNLTLVFPNRHYGSRLC